MKLSVVVLTYNQRPVTERLMETLLPYAADRPEVEVVVVDNGSADGTAESIRKMGAALGPRLKVIETGRNTGVAAGRNTGLRAASGELLMLLDNDTEVTAKAMDGLMDYLQKHPECGLCAPALYGPAGELQDSAKPFPGVGVKVRHLLQRGRSLTAGETDAMKCGHPFYVIGACQLFRRRVWEKAGPLDEKIFYGPEDADFCMRIRECGFSVDYVPELRITHHWQRATRRRPWSRLSLLHMRALLYFYRKHRRWW